MEAEKIKKLRNLKVDRIIEKGMKNKQWLRQLLLNHVRLLSQFQSGANRRKAQNVKDHNFIELFKEENPEEFKIILDKYILKYGKDKKWKKKI